MVLSGPGRAVPHNTGSVRTVVFGHAGSDPGTLDSGQVTAMVVHKVSTPVLQHV